MPHTQVKPGDRMFEDALSRHVHENVTNVKIIREFDFLARIEFTIENKEKTKILRTNKSIHNEDIKYHDTSSLILQANKIASVIDELPTYIPDEQIVNWVEAKLDRRNYEM